jgi:hypothetical protein
MNEKHKWTIRINDGDGFWEYVYPDGSGDVAIYDIAVTVKKLLESESNLHGNFIGHDPEQ